MAATEKVSLSMKGNQRMRSKFRSVVVGLVLMVLTAATFAAESEPPASAVVTAALQPYLDQYKLAGAIGIIADRSGKVHYKNLLGYADVEAKKPISEDNVFWIASMSKMFVGASIMMLVDEGKVSLDDPVTKFIPQLNKWMVVEERDQSHVVLKSPVRPVTIRHVLSHTSGRPAR
jgi:CubicO group peptidase (beta-lactamase class C family)